MIKKLSLKNFKSFKKLNELELKNLTIIVGKNSCGKSSILQSLLLLKQTKESTLDTPLALEGKYLKFSNIKEITYGLPPINQANISYTFYLESNDASGTVELQFKNKKINKSYDVIIGNHITTTSTTIINHNKLTKKNIKKIIEPNISFYLRKRTIEEFQLKFDKFILGLMELKTSEKEKSNLPPEEIKIPWKYMERESGSLNEDLGNEIDAIRYLSPVRAIPERVYVHYSHDVSELNEDGSNAAHILWAKQNEKVLWKGQRIPLKQAVNECITCMGLEQNISPDRIGDILYKIGIYEKVSGGKVSLSDVGFGYSQILPVIIMGLINSKDNLMLLEQPEIHLHPSSAANLADLFLNFVQDDKRFIIETHSPELINRLRLRVIEDPSLKEKINIVFVESNDELGATIKQFTIDENGMFPEWPDGFLDESEKLAQAMLQARLNRS